MIAGVINGLLGLSGGVITIPALTLLFYIFNFPDCYLLHLAIGTSLAAMVPNGMASTWMHNRHHNVAWPIIYMLLPTLLVGGVAGAIVGYFIDERVLRILFGIFVIVIACHLFFQLAPNESVEKHPSAFLGVTYGFLIGFLSVLLGIGGGTFMIPLLIFYGFSQIRSVGTSAAVGVVISFIGAICYLFMGLGTVRLPNTWGFIYIPAFLTIGIVSALISPLAARFATRMQHTHLRQLVAVVLAVVGLLMVVR